ncbi:cryptochrome/photolyase family protein [Spirillospora sp. CA-253888]
MMDTVIMLFTRDLRVHDNPALATACGRARRVVPLFVFDDVLLSHSPNRARFLLDALAGLRDGLRRRGGGLVLRRGDPAAETARLVSETGADAVFLADDVSPYARRRRDRLEELCGAEGAQVVGHPGLTVVPPGEVTPAGGDHYKVFTPYWRAWAASSWRPVAPPPERVPLDDAPADQTTLEAIADAFAKGTSPDLPEGGERAGRARARAWLDDHLADYDAVHNALAADETSQLSPYIRFGCVSPLELAAGALRRPDGDPYARQLAWRDFHHQVTAAFPDIGTRDYRPRGDGWHDDIDALDAWREGRTGVPIVDAGMRQLLREGRMHNRARMITASFLTRDLKVDWRAGLAHFDRWLVDGDLADNAGNWQWIAGTGNNPRPDRVLNPLRQAARFDPRGEYVRRYVPELAGLADPHRPWRLPPEERGDLDYPPPVIEPPAGR